MSQKSLDHHEQKSWGEVLKDASTILEILAQDLKAGLPWQHYF